MTTQFVNVASLVPDQHHCNLKLRVLSVETIAETIHPETGKIIQSAEAIVGDDTACILLNLKNDQVNLLARNARLQVLNAHVNMYRGFMRLEVNEEEDNSGYDAEDQSRPSITAILEEEEEDEMNQREDGDKGVVVTSGDFSTAASSIPRGFFSQGDSSSAASEAQQRQHNMFGANGGGGMTTTLAAATSSSMSTATIVSGSSSNSLASSSSSSSLSRDQMEVEMRLGTGGSVPLVEYYRAIEFTYFSTVEPVGR